MKSKIFFVNALKEKGINRFVCDECDQRFTVIDSGPCDGFGWDVIRCNTCSGSHCPKCGHYALRKI